MYRHLGSWNGASWGLGATASLQAPNEQAGCEAVSGSTRTPVWQTEGRAVRALTWTMAADGVVKSRRSGGRFRSKRVSKPHGLVGYLGGRTKPQTTSRADLSPSQAEDTWDDATSVRDTARNDPNPRL